MAKKLGDLRAKHDIGTVVGNLEKELAQTKAEIDMQSFVGKILGTLDLDKTLPAWPTA